MFVSRSRFGWLWFVVLISCLGCGGKSATKPRTSTTHAPISSFSAVAGDEEVVLTWINPSNPAPDAVLVVRQTGAYPADRNDGQTIFEGSADTFTDHGITNGVPYYYAAWAEYDVVTSTSYSEAVRATATPVAPPDPLPAPPTSFASIAQTHAVALSWTNPSDADLAAIEVRRRAGTAPTGPTDGASVYVGLGTSVIDTGLDPEQTYYYRAWAKDLAGQYSGSSAQTSRRPLYEYREIEIPAGDLANKFPTRIGSGDRDFGGHGPRMTTRVYTSTPSSNVSLYVYFNAIETQSDYTEAEGTWTVSSVSIPSGFVFDSWLTSHDQTYAVTDTDHSVDTYAPGGLIPYLEVRGDTDGDDVGNTTSDDTELILIRWAKIRFRVRG